MIGILGGLGKVEQMEAFALRDAASSHQYGDGGCKEEVKEMAVFALRGGGALGAGLGWAWCWGAMA